MHKTPHQGHDNRQHGYQDDYEYYEESPHSQQYQSERPLDPSVERVRRKLMRLMLVTMLITIVLVLVVLGTVIYKVSRPAASDASTATPVESELSVPTTAHMVPATQTPDTQLPAQQSLAALAKTTEPINEALDLPVGTRILSQSLSGDLLSLETLAPSGGTELVIYNYREGNIVARLRIPANDMPSPDTDDNGAQ